MRSHLSAGLLALLILGLAACQSSPQATAISPADTTIVTISRPPLATRTATIQPSATPTRSPTTTRTRTPTPTAIPDTPPPTSTRLPNTPTATPTDVEIPVVIEPQPAGKDGPWVVFPCSGEASRSSPAFTGANGENCTRFSLPEFPSAGRYWSMIPAPHGGYVAFRVIPWGEDGEDMYNPSLNGVDNYLWILKLPENRIVRKIPLVDEASWEKAHMNGAYTYPYEVAPPMAIMYTRATYLWSPDGRYLAFSASAHSSEGLGLFLYDTLTDQVNHLTDGYSSPAAYTWSPDGNWIVYEEIESTYCEDWGCRLDGGYLYAISIQGVQRTVTQEDGSPTWDIEWTSGHSLLFANFVGMNPAYRLYSMDLESDEFRSLYNENIWAYIYIPPTDTILIVPGVNNPLPGNLYVLDPQSGSTWPYHLNGYEEGWRLFWNDEMQLIKADRTDPTTDEAQAVGLKPDGEVAFMIHGTYYIDPSPDGMWFASTIGWKEEFLFDATGQVAAQLLKGEFARISSYSHIFWRSDSSALYAGIEDCQPGIICLVRYDRNHDWAQVPIGQYSADQGDGPWFDVFLIEP